MFWIHSKLFVIKILTYCKDTDSVSLFTECDHLLLQTFKKNLATQFVTSINNNRLTDKTQKKTSVKPTFHKLKKNCPLVII